MADLSTKCSDLPEAVEPTIMVVEDDVLIRLMIADELRQKAYTVIEAATGDEALAMLNSAIRIDLVLTDVNMPGKTDGLALAKHLRNEHRMTKIVLLSGEQLVSRDDTWIANAFFPKPCNMPTLLAFIDSLLRPASSL